MTEIIEASDKFAKLNPRANIIGPFYELGFEIEDENKTPGKPIEIDNEQSLPVSPASTSTNEEEVLN